MSVFIVLCVLTVSLRKHKTILFKKYALPNHKKASTKERSCADLESFFRGGPTLTTFFFVDEGRDHPNTTISGSSSTRKRNAIYMAFRWRADGGPKLNAGLVALWFYR